MKIIILVCMSVISQVAFGESSMSNNPDWDSSNFALQGLDRSPPISAWFYEKSFRLMPTFGESFDANLGNMASYLNRESEPGLRPVSAWRITGQLFAGVLGGVIGSVVGIIIARENSNCGEDEDLCPLGDIAAGMIFGLPLGTTLGVFASGKDSHYGTFLGSFAGSMIGMLTYWVMLRHDITPDIGFSSNVVLLFLVVSGSATLGYYGARDIINKQPHRTGAFFVPGFGSRVSGDKREWVFGVNLVNLRF